MLDNARAFIWLRQLFGPEGDAVAGSEQSRTLSVLSESESVTAVCQLIGVSSMGFAGGGAGDRAACARVVEQCQSNVGGALGLDEDDAGGDLALPVPGGDARALLGCPVTFAELDGCIAAVLTRGRDTYGASVSCDMPTLPDVNALVLFAVPACIGVVLRCPELLSLGPSGQ